MYMYARVTFRCSSQATLCARVCLSVRWILKNLGDDLTEGDIDDMIADVDTDGSGWVDYNGLSNRSYCTQSIGIVQSSVCSSVCDAVHCG